MKNTRAMASAVAAATITFTLFASSTALAQPTITPGAPSSEDTITIPGRTGETKTPTPAQEDTSDPSSPQQGAQEQKPSSGEAPSRDISKSKSEYVISTFDTETGIYMLGTGPKKGDGTVYGVIEMPNQRATGLNASETATMAMHSIKMMNVKIAAASGLSDKIPEVVANLTAKLDTVSKGNAQAILSGEAAKNLDEKDVARANSSINVYKQAITWLTKLQGKSDDDIKATTLAAADGDNWNIGYTLTATTSILLDGKVPMERTTTIPMRDGQIDGEWQKKRLIELGITKEKPKEEPKSQPSAPSGSTGGSDSKDSGSKDDAKSEESNVDGAKTFEELKSSLDSTIGDADKKGNKLSLTLAGIDGGVKGEKFTLGGSDPQYAASVVKVIVATAAKDKLSGDEKVKVDGDVMVNGSDGVNGKEGEYTVDELTKWMIQKSDNTATNALIRHLVGPEDWKASKFDKINEYSKKAGTNNYTLGNKMLSGETKSKVSSTDAVTYLTKLQKGEIIDKAKSDSIIDLMKGQEVKTKIAGIAPEGKFATKTGENKGVAHEIGYLFTDAGTIAFAVVGTGEDQGTLNSAIQDVGKKVFDQKPVEKEGTKKEDSKDSKDSDSKSDDKKDDSKSDEKSDEKKDDKEDK